MTAALDHITLDTGHVRRSPRPEVRDDIFAMLRISLEAAVEQPRSRVPVPMMEGYTYSVTPERGTLMVTIWGTVQRTPAPVVTFGVAPIGSDARGLWSAMHMIRGGLEFQRYATNDSVVPAPPWLAARIEVGATLIKPADLLWMADFERCVAWAWLEMQHVG